MAAPRVDAPRSPGGGGVEIEDRKEKTGRGGPIRGQEEDGAGEYS